MAGICEKNPEKYQIRRTSEPGYYKRDVNNECFLIFQMDNVMQPLNGARVALPKA